MEERVVPQPLPSCWKYPAKLCPGECQYLVPQAECIHDRGFIAASFTCPRCQRVSYNPTDRAEGFCGACKAWTGTPGTGS